MRSERDAKAILAAYGIPTPREVLAGTAAEAARGARSIGFPVVLKACGPTLAHKSDLGLVRVGLGSAAEVRAAHRAITEAATDAGLALDGVLVAEQVTDGVETVVGVAPDPLFGPVVMVGLGGVFVEVLRDVAFRVPPFGRDEARRMLTELRGFPLLAGARGRPPADVGALVDVVLRVQRLALDLDGELVELDLNPLLVRPKGRGAVALDALAVPGRGASARQ
nr:acetate--CoA ligase family protein [Rhabdothermincola sediminis]